jgi:hypothetical protein
MFALYHGASDLGEKIRPSARFSTPPVHGMFKFRFSCATTTC